MQSFRRMLLPVLALLLLTVAACSPTASLGNAGEALTEAVSQPAAAAAQEETEQPSDVFVQESGAAIAALEGTLSNIYETVNPSVVHIQVLADPSSQPVPQIPGFEMPEAQPRGGEGSGFVWDDQGHIITNNHVVTGANTITVVFANGLRVPAEIVGTDPDSDLAVLQVDVPAEQLQPVTVADSTETRVGELVVAIGNPFGQEGTMTVGFVSALGRLLRVDAQMPAGPGYSIPDIIQTDAAINPGNSGGVLLNDQGEVVGVTTAILSRSGSNSGVGFAVPSVIVNKVVPVLIETGEFEHPYLGVSGTTLVPEVAEAMDLPQDLRGALLMEIVPEGPAAEAGLQSSEEEVQINGATVRIGGDVVIAAADQPVNSMDDLITILARYGQVGEPFTLTVVRNGEEETIEVTLGARPEETPMVAVEEAGGEDEVDPEAEAEVEQRAWLGILGSNLAPEIAEAMELPAEQDGVLVVEVQPESAADEAGLQGGDETVTIDGQEVLIGGDVITAVDGEPVASMRTLQERLAEQEPGDEVSLTVLRDGEEVTLPVTLGERPLG